MTPNSTSDAFEQYKAHGWALCAIPKGVKGPTAAGWNTKGATLHVPGDNLGLLHALSGTCALDIDDLPTARAWLSERGVSLDELLTAPDAVQIVSGRTGSAKLLFGMLFPMASKKVIVDGRTILEFRSAAANGLSVQDVLPPSLHPSGSVYRWGGLGDWRRLPALPGPLAAIWDSLVTTPSAVPENTPQPPFQAPVTASFEEITAAINALDPDCDRKTWVEIGMALESTGHPEAFNLWNSWSSRGRKYKAAEMAGQWKSFAPRSDGITINSLFHHAYRAGWKRPVPDMTEAFKAMAAAPVKVESPDAAREFVSPSHKVPACDLSLWPPQLLARAAEVATEVGCDVIVPLMAGLCAVSGAADKRSRLVVNQGWRIPPTVWAMTIGEPADKKTPGSRPMFAPLYKIEAEDRDRYNAAMMGWHGQEAAHAADMKKFREWSESPESSLPGAVPPTVRGLPEQPHPVRIVVNDATTQKVVSMAAPRPRGFLLYNDEMNRWLTKIGDPRSTDDRGLWIQGFETGPYAMDRQSSGSIFAENLALSMYGNCQPAVLRKTLTDAARDGIVQRFLMVGLDSSKNRMWKDSAPEWASSKGDYEQLLRQTYALPAQDYQLSAEGLIAFKEFSRWCLEIRDVERTLGRSEPYQTSIGKLEGQCGRVMLLFHLMMDPHNPTVPVETARRAIDLTKFYFTPMLRHAYLNVAQNNDDYAKRLIDLVIQWSGVRTVVTMSEARKVMKRTGENDDRPAWQTDQLIRVTMDELTEMGLVSMFQDHPRYPVWTINPNLATTFAAYRKEIIAKKQASIDLVTANAGVRRKKVIGNDDFDAATDPESDG